mgnify:FL=1
MVRLICFLAVGGNANVPCRSVWGMVAFPIESHIAMSGAMNRPVCGSVEELCSRQLQNTNMFNSLWTRHCYGVSVHGIVTESLYTALLRSLCTRHCYGMCLRDRTVFIHGIDGRTPDTEVLCQAVSPLPAVRVNRFSGFPIVFERRPCVRLCWIY